jgi:hypothetical protein
MPKDEFDFEDPLELNGVGLVCAEDTTETMTECFIEEFLRLGHNHKQILALFRNPHYLGMNMALEKRGEPFVRMKISEAFALRGKAIAWDTSVAEPTQAEHKVAKTPAATESQGMTRPSVDPMGAPAPEINF